MTHRSAHRVIPLRLLPAGRCARIAQVLGQPDHVHRLEEFGLRGGPKIEMFRPGNPCILRLAGNKICLRSDELLSVHGRADRPHNDRTGPRHAPSPLPWSAIPNTGKSTLFSGLVGVHQHVGNYPGVTVEKKVGQMTVAGRRFEVIDLPGLYSLAPRSRDEMVVVDLLLGRREEAAPVDAVVCIVDASNLERNLYLVSQVLELGLPTVLALNMLDVAAGRGIRIDLARFQRQLGIPIVPIQANRRTGLPKLKAVLAQLAGGEGRESRAAEGRGGDFAVGRLSPLPSPLSPSLLIAAQSADDSARRTECLPHLRRQHVATSPLPEEFETEVASLESELAAGGGDSAAGSPLPRSLVRRLLLDTSGYLQGTLLDDADGHWKDRIEAARGRLAAAGCPVPAVETSARYDWARRVLERRGHRAGPATAPRASDRIDRVLTHRLWGTLIFAVVMVLMFQSVFVWAQPATERDRMAHGRRRRLAPSRTWPKGPCEACWPTA